MRTTIKNRREAYDQVKPKRENRKAMILSVLVNGDPNGMTADEIGDKLVADGKIPENSPNFVRPRLTEMSHDGILKVVGCRLSNAGRKSAIWKIVKREVGY